MTGAANKANEAADYGEYDPLFGGLAGQLREKQRALHQMTAQTPSQRHRWQMKLGITVQERWLDVVLVAVPSLLAVAGSLQLAVTWPWDSGSGDGAPVAIAAASVVALGSIVGSAVALPLERAANLGAGFTTGLIRRPRIWLSGLTVAVLLAFLFWLVSLGPDRDAGFGAGLLAAAAFGAYWAVARWTLASADSLTFVTDESRRLARTSARMADWGEKMAELSFSESLDHSTRATILCDYRWNLGGGAIRQLVGAAAVRCRAGATDEAIILQGGAAEAFETLLDRSGGATHGYNGVPSAVVEGTRSLVTQTMRQGDDYAATLLAGRLGKFACLAHQHRDTSEIRLHGRGHLRSLLDEVWDDMYSRVPPTVAAELVRSATVLPALRLVGELDEVLRTASQTAARAALADKQHIALPLANGYVTGLYAIAAAESEVRLHALESWTEGAGALAAVSGLGIGDNAGSPILPGTGLGTTGLQEVIHDIAATAPSDAVGDVMDALVPWLGRVMSAVDVPKRGDGPPRLLGDALNLLLNISLAAVAAGDRLPEPERLARSLLVSAAAWTEGKDSSVVADALRWDDVASRVWSVTMAAGTLAADAEMVRQHVSERLAGLIPEAHHLLDFPTTATFFACSRLVAGDSHATVAEMLKLEGRGRLNETLRSGGIHRWTIDHRLAAPGCVRPYVFAPAAVDVVDDWMFDQFPPLRGADNGTQTHS